MKKIIFDSFKLTQKQILHSTSPFEKELERVELKITILGKRILEN